MMGMMSSQFVCPFIIRIVSHPLPAALLLHRTDTAMTMSTCCSAVPAMPCRAAYCEEQSAAWRGAARPGLPSHLSKYARMFDGT